jgi:hypothetical protein
VCQLRQEWGFGSARLLSALGECDRGGGSLNTDPGTAFFCRWCQRTVSLLPSFALSYRLLNSELTERFFLGGLLQGAEQRWASLLRSYRHQAQRFCQQLIAIIGAGFGLAPPQEPEVGKLLAWLTRLCGGLGPATEQLVNRWAVTLFGFYRCHQRTVDG